MTFFSELKRPFNLITTLLAIIGIVLSIIFYLDGKKEKKISYSVNEPTSLIFDSKNSTPKLKLYEHDSIPVTGNVYLLTGTIWNSGDFPINKQELRLPISLGLSNLNRILDFKIVKQKDSSIARFYLQKANNNLLNLDWQYFDPGFGFVFQVIYVGVDDPGFNLKGKVLDIPSFTKVEKSENKRELMDWIFLIGGPISLILILLFELRDKKRTGKFDKISLVLIIGLAISLIATYWSIFFNSSIIPI